MNTYQKRILSLIVPGGLGRVTLSSLGNQVGLKSKQSVKYHLDSLVAAGYIKVTKQDGLIVAIKPISKEKDIVCIPVYGAANCGDATLEAEENFEGYLTLSKKMFKGKLYKKDSYFALRAVGESMNRAKFKDYNGIEEGDYIIIDKTATSPENNDIVLSVINGAANIKRFKRTPDRISLTSESSEQEKYPPIIIHPDDDYFVNGVVIQVVKN